LIQGLTSTSTWTLNVRAREERYVRLQVERATVSLKLELVNDVPSHVGSILVHPVLGRLDSAENILANKITALLDRQEPKDLADLWGFCCLRGLSIEGALADAGSKAAGVFPADLARILLSATLADWELVRWIEAPTAERFLADLRRLGEDLLLLHPPQ